MMDQLIIALANAFIRALKAFFNFDTSSNNNHDLEESFAALDEEDEALIEEKLSQILNIKPLDGARYITPFERQITKHLENLQDLTRSEIVENFLLALGSTAEEISLFADGDITCSVEQEESSSYIILHGHLKWDVDNLSPKVYAIVMELLKDGFTFMADSKTFVITSRVKK